jgi:hypothetical protein
MATPREKEGNGSKTKKEGGVINKVMATKLEEKGCNGRTRGVMATKLGKSGNNGKIRRKGGDGRTKSTMSESQEQGARNDN